VRASAENVTETASYDPGLYESLVAVEDRHFWFRARNRAIMAVFESIRNGLSPGYRVLEVGCGTGNVLRDLQKSATGGTVIGTDLHIEGLRYAQRRVNPALLVRADLGHPPFLVRFDVVGLFDVLEHLDDDVAVLRQLRGLLAPDGALMLTVPAHRSLWSYFDVGAHHRRRYEQAELREKLVAAGYSVEYLTPYMTVLQPVLWAGRRLAASRGQRPADAASAWTMARADLRVRPVSGAMLGFLLKQEIRWLRRRRQLPMGASLLAVARATA
jgi:SAM-dependent methyltransferase